MDGDKESARKAKHFDNNCRYRAHAKSGVEHPRPCGGGAAPAPHRHERRRSVPSPFLGCRAADSRQKGSGKVPANSRDVFESQKTFPPAAWAFLGSFRLISRPRTRSQAPA